MEKLIHRIRRRRRRKKRRRRRRRCVGIHCIWQWTDNRRMSETTAALIYS